MNSPGNSKVKIHRKSKRNVGENLKTKCTLQASRGYNTNIGKFKISIKNDKERKSSYSSPLSSVRIRDAGPLHS